MRYLWNVSSLYELVFINICSCSSSNMKKERTNGLNSHWRSCPNNRTQRPSSSVNCWICWSSNYRRLHLKVRLERFSILHITQTNNQWNSADTVRHLDIKYLKLSHRFVEEETTRCQIKYKLKFLSHCIVKLRTLLFLMISNGPKWNGILKFLDCSLLLYFIGILTFRELTDKDRNSCSTKRTVAIKSNWYSLYSNLLGSAQYRHDSKRQTITKPNFKIKK